MGRGSFQQCNCSIYRSKICKWGHYWAWPRCTAPPAPLLHLHRSDPTHIWHLMIFSWVFFFFSKENLSHWYVRRVWRADCKNQQSHDVSSLWAVKEKAVFQSTGPRGHSSEWMLLGERTIYFYTKKFVQTDSKLLSPTQLPLWHRGQSDSDVKPCVCTVTCMQVLSKLKRGGC